MVSQLASRRESSCQKAGGRQKLVPDVCFFQNPSILPAIISPCCRWFPRMTELTTRYPRIGAIPCTMPPCHRDTMLATSSALWWYWRKGAQRSMKSPPRASARISLRPPIFRLLTACTRPAGRALNCREATDARQCEQNLKRRLDDGRCSERTKHIPHELIRTTTRRSQETTSAI